MRKAFRFLGIALLGLLVVAAAFAAYIASTGIPKYPPGRIDRRVEVTPEKVERGRKLASLTCVSCHQDPTTGKLTGKRLVDAPKQFGPIFSKNITHDSAHGIGAWSDGELLYFLRTGIHRTGQYVPPYMPLYWLLISAAAYRAVWQFMTARFEWEKTEHGVAARRARCTP